MFAQIASHIIHAPRRTIVAILFLSALILAGARHTDFISDFDSSLPDRSPLSAQIHDIQDRFESRNTLAFLVSGGTEAARMAATCTLSTGLQAMPGIAPGRVYGVGANAVKFVENSQDDLAVTGLQALCETNRLLTADVLDGLGPQRALVQAPNGDLVVYADLNVISGDFGPLLKTIDSFIEKSSQKDVKIAYSGQPAFLAQNDIFSKRIALFFPIIMALVLLLHWEALRNWQAVIIPIFTGLFATLLGLGFYGWLRQPLDTYTVLAPVLILAVGAGHSVQLLKRYMEEIRARVQVGHCASKLQNEAAITATLIAMGPVLTIAVAGAATCLFSLLLLDVSALARFGLLAGLGLICALVLELCLIPAIRTILPLPVVTPRYGELSHWWQNSLRRVGEFALTGSKTIILSALLLATALLAWGVAHVKASHSMSVYTSPDVPVQRTVTDLSNAGVGPYVLDIMIDTHQPGRAFEPKTLASALSLEQALKENPNVRAILSPATIIGFLSCRFEGKKSCTMRPPTSSEEAKQIWDVLFSGGKQAGLIDPSGQYLRLRAFVSTDETVAAQRLIDSVSAIANRQQLDISLGGSAVTAKALADGIVSVSLEKAALLLIIVMLIGGLAFRSWRMGLLFMVPTGLTIATNFAYLGWSGTTLNVATAAVATIAVGVGLDYLVYLTFRIREAVDQGLNYMDAIRVAHLSAGGAALCVAMAVAVGYAVLIFSPGYLVHHWIAILVPLTMVASLFGALFVFPFLLRLLRPKVGSPSKLFADWDIEVGKLFPPS
jgi:uncharacterized protein